MTTEREKLAAYIDHTALSPTVTSEAIIKLTEEAKKYNFYAVCVPPSYVKTAKEQVKTTSVKVCTVIGFPLGYSAVEAKIFELFRAIEDGADELDVVMNLSAFKSGDSKKVSEELILLTEVVKKSNRIIKIIIETAYLNREEIIKACNLCAEAGVHYVKTSTGFAPKGAETETVMLMREVLPENIKIKASGGIRTFREAEAFVNAGADRIGTSSGIKIVGNV